jgi:hypothetical protein
MRNFRYDDWSIKMKLDKKILGAALAFGMAGGGASAATFNAFDGSTSSYALTCTDCTIKAFDDTSNSANDGLAGVLSALTGDAFGPINGSPASRDPSLTGEDDEIDFLTAIAALFGDTYVSGSYAKDDDGGNGASGFNDVTVTSGDWILWKTAAYAGVARVTGIGSTSTFSFSGSNELSHFAKISVSNDPDGDLNVVPLPAGLPLLVAGLGALGVLRAKKRKAA